MICVTFGTLTALSWRLHSSDLTRPYRFFLGSWALLGLTRFCCYQFLLIFVTFRSRPLHHGGFVPLFFSSDSNLLGSSFRYFFHFFGVSVGSNRIWGVGLIGPRDFDSARGFDWIFVPFSWLNSIESNKIARNCSIFTANAVKMIGLQIIRHNPKKPRQTVSFLQ